MENVKSGIGLIESVHEVLNHIQVNLNAPKNHYNAFGKYYYRNCEDILNALKPFLEETGATITIEDEIVLIGNHFYIKATASLNFCASGSMQSVSASAYAREPEQKKGMDEPQITGTASSYARKYALNALFAIDDTKEPDATNKHGKDEQAKPDPKKEQTIAETLQEMAQYFPTIYKISVEDAKKVLELHIGKNFNEATAEDKEKARQLLKSVVLTNRKGELNGTVEDLLNTERA